MDLVHETQGPLSVVTVKDTRIDAAVALAFKDRMRDATDGAQETVVLNLSNVDFIDSSGLGAIVAAMKHMNPDRKLVLAGLTQTVEKVFKLTRMDSVFSVYPSLDDALSAKT